MLGQLFDDERIDSTVETLAAIETSSAANTMEKSDAQRAITDCDKRIGNFEAALGATQDPDTIAGFARQIESIRAERKSAELRLRQLTTGRGMTQDEIREVVASLADLVALLANASPADRRAVYEAAQLEVLYDHENQQAQISVAPRVIARVGGASATQSTRGPWRAELVAA